MYREEIHDKKHWKNIEKNKKNVLTCILKHGILIYSSKLMKNKNINFEKISNIFSEKLKYNTSKLLIFIFCKKKNKKIKKSIDIDFEW